MRKRVLHFAACVAFSLFAPALYAADEPGVRVFILRYRQIEEAALLIRPHLSPAGTVTLTPRLRAITIADREENLRMIAKVIAEFDTPPRGFTFAVKLVRARADVQAGSIEKEIGGLGERLKHRPSEMSGGEQQRVAVARALAMKPALLLADEPTGDLDETTADSLHELLKNMHAEQGLTSVIATHNPRLAAACNRVFRLERGQLHPQ